jgi:hypothetical protein
MVYRCTEVSTGLLPRWVLAGRNKFPMSSTAAKLETVIVTKDHAWTF